MIVSIHQPDYLPWQGYFNKIKNCDIFVFLDTATYSRNGFHNRNKIKTPQGWTYLTIPIPRSQCFLSIKDVCLPEDISWASKHWKSIKMNYRKAPFWDNYQEFFNNLYINKIKKFKNLGDLNIYIINHLCREFGIKAKLLRDSDMSINHKLKSSELLVEIIKNSGADRYISGPSGKSYLDRDKFKDNNIKLEFQNFKSDQYNQLFEEYIPGLSALDLLFNCGPDAKNYL